ncbi:MAG: AMP-binding protein [Rhodospirillaceae bacterium]|jgi:fatty-acyl-CoA synthase|nr:AMP-binding protein [Rhodospirillaceae bacterium]MBT5898046.1 AMP-binding protein [Rhodospirillaceae bacterium]MBT6426849.1 AMP-binding protein [Rhodospirillaceae bacterium]MBT7759000.1 AMP-binding protein [Rhodospirillaceae bacterium]
MLQENTKTLNAIFGRVEADREARPWLHLELAGDGASFSRAELLRDGARLWPADLFAAHAQRRDIVLISMKISQTTISAYLGAIRAGLVPAFVAPLTEKQHSDRHWRNLNELCRNTGATVLYVDDNQFVEARKLISSSKTKVFSPRQCDGHEKWIAAFKPNPCDVAFMQFTSGTTGMRKAVNVTHAMLLDHIRAYGGCLPLRDDDVIVSWLPLYHDMGLIACFMMGMVAGTTLVILDPIEWVRVPSTLFDAIEKHQGTICYLPNFSFNHLTLTTPTEAAYDLHGMRAFINCSEPCLESTFEKFLTRFAEFGVRAEQLQTSYAMAESIFAVTQSKLLTPTRARQSAKPAANNGNGDGGGLSFLSSGKPIPGAAVRIRGESGELLPAGEVGEIETAAPWLFQGYVVFNGQGDGGLHIDNSDISDGWHRTGDLGLLDDDELFVVGRIKDIIIVNGRNYLAHEIEAAAAEVLGIKKGRQVAFGRTDEFSGSEELIILTELETPAQQCDKDLRRQVKKAVLDEFALNPRVEFVAPGTLIKSTSGKLSRDKSREVFLNNDRR